MADPAAAEFGHLPNVVGRVVLLRYPVRLGQLLGQYHADLMRELQLVVIGSRSDSATHAPRRLLELTTLLTTRYAAYLAAPARQRDEAVARCDRETNVTYPVVPETAEVVRQFAEIMDEVDEFCRSGDLLTLAMPDDAHRLRRWTVAEFLAQAGGDEPTPWAGPW